jgi:hypothetical protein
MPLVCLSQTDSTEPSTVSEFTSSDSLSIFQLIDSLLNLNDEKEKSQLAIRVGYNSNIVATGRPFELGQFGISGGSAFYHKSGLFVDATGYWSNEYSPSYFLTAGSLGYMKSFKKGWSMLTEYTRYFYNLSEEYASVSYLNNVTATALWEYKKLNTRFDYSLYTGEKIGHRLTPSISLHLEKRKWKKIRKISFYPTVSVMTGIEQVTRYEKLYDTRLQALFRIRNNLPLFRETVVNEFGVMNYGLMAPLSIAIKNWNLLLNYTYNIPIKLPGETTNLTNSGYLSFSIVRYFEIGK